MASLTIAALVQVSLLSTSAQPYAEAYQQCLESGQPLVILVGAEWCPACQQMKNSVIPQAQRQGILKTVAYTEVNTDHDSALSQRLMRQNLIPQLIVYQKSGGTWQRHELIGGQSISSVKALIDRTLAGSSPASAAAKVAEKEPTVRQ